MHDDVQYPVGSAVEFFSFKNLIFLYLLIFLFSYFPIYLIEQKWVELPVPADMQVGMFADQILLQLRSDWAIGKENDHYFISIVIISFMIVDHLCL